MKILSILSLLTVAMTLSLGAQVRGAVTVQTASDVFNGRSYLWLEAENFSSLGADPEGDGWKIVSKETPVTSAGGLDILPASSNVSGTALLDDLGGGQHADTATYEVEFLTAGTYQFYSRQTMYDSNGNNSFSNEDSIFLSPAFNLNSSSDWVGFEGLNFDDQDPEVDIPETGFALDPDGFKSDTGDSENEGWYAIRDWRIKSAGVLQGSGSQDPSLQNGVFSWYNRPAFVSTGVGGGFDSDFGFKTEYIVTPEQVGQTLTFEIGTRENYGVFDGFLFIQDDNVDLLDLFTQEEVDAILPVAPDADFDDSTSVDGADLAIWETNFATGTTNATGDADGDADADGTDFLVWQQQYTGPPAINAVPEPTSVVLLSVLAMISLGVRVRSAGQRY